MGILSGMLIVLGVKFLTGKKLSVTSKPTSQNDILQKTDHTKEPIPQKLSHKILLRFDAIKEWINTTLGKK
jgi:hypothetical protein